MAGTGTGSGRKRRAGENEAEGNAGLRKKNRAALGERREDGLRDSASIRELARPYLLAVGRLPLDVLNTTWSAGRNRAIEAKHVRELCEAFKINGLQRHEPRNRLLCLCSADDARRVRRGASEEAADGQPDKEMDLLRWAEVNSGSVEVIAGQHRIAALREYSRDSGGARPDQLWWTCELYDQGASNSDPGPGWEHPACYLKSSRFGFRGAMLATARTGASWVRGTRRDQGADS